MITLLQIDAFTDRPFAGNQAAVCLMDAHRDDKWMQNMANEMNLSETAFVTRRGEGFDLRWFTPACEVKLCGHATLASAHALWEMDWLRTGEEARFHTLSGLLTVRQKEAGLEMDFPAEPTSPIRPPNGLIEALGVQAKFVGQNRMDLFVEAKTPQMVRNMSPDMVALRRYETRGVIVTAVSDTNGVDFISRFFAPAVGIDEDPVTGSAHCCLGPYWQGRLKKADFCAFQASKRGGTIGVSVRGQRILLTGRAVTVFRGELIE